MTINMNIHETLQWIREQNTIITNSNKNIDAIVIIILTMMKTLQMGLTMEGWIMMRALH